MFTGYDTEVEREVIGSMLNSHEDALLGITDLHETDFSVQEHKDIFSEIKKIFEITQELPTPSEIVFSRQASQSGLLELMIGLQASSVGLDIKYLISLLTSLREARKISSFCENIRKKHSKLLRHDYQVFSDNFKQEAFEILSSPNEKRDAALVSEMARLQTCYKKAVENQELRNQGKQVFHGIPTGYCDLDNKVYGFAPGHLIVIGGRPGQGKTSFLLNLVANMKESKIAIFSLEMQANDLFNKFVLKESAVNYENFIKGTLTHNDITKIYGAEKSIIKKEIVIDDYSLVNPSQLYSKLLRIKKLNGLDIVFIDYLQLMHGSDSNYENNQVKVASISRALKSIAKELNIPVVALAQVNRSPMLKEDKTPQMSDLRESGAIEADADVILLLHRPYLYLAHNDPKRSSANPNQLMVNIAKNRFGGTGMIDLFFNLETGDIKNMTSKKESAQINERHGAFSPSVT